ncbi:MAG: ornithine cyclodeaminase family protein [Rhizobiales bacterium]|nr:ornithine cyclodeaminase family protein [Hyphomicrobiales bacterium]
MRIVHDHQLNTKQLMPLAIIAVEQFFIAAANGNTVSPTRHNVKTQKGGLTFTIGAETEFSNSIGFRVYDTYPSGKATNTEQLVAVYSTQTSRLKGLFIGSKLGAIRTAAINGLAIKYMSNPTAKIATIIGAGHQAQFQIAALLAVRRPDLIYIHNRTPQNAKKLIKFLQKDYDVEFKLSNNLKHSLSKSDIIIYTTSSHQPVFKTQWLKPECYLASIGPKQKNRHELPLDITQNASLIISDAPKQLNDYKQPYFIDDTSPIKPLENIITNPTKPNNSIHLFLSTGRSGTEVIIGNAILSNSALIL